MPLSSHNTNFRSTRKNRTLPNDFADKCSHNAGMARRGDASDRIDWYLREWMKALGLRQVDMIERTGWSKATTSQLCTGIQNFSPRILQDAADAMNLKTYELLMHPEDAMALRRLRGAAAQIVSIAEPDSKAKLDDKRNGTDG